MPRILAIDTSTRIFSVSLFDEKNILWSVTSEEGYNHASALAPSIAEMRKSGYELDSVNAIAVIIGPGSYTGLRVGLSTAKGLCYGLNIPLIALTSLDALAFGAAAFIKHERIIMPMIDARRMEVYTAFYDADAKQLERPKALILTREVMEAYIEKKGPILAIGDGAHKIKNLGAISGLTIKPLHINATFMRKPSLIKYDNKDFVDIAYEVPLYLKPPNVTKPRRTKL